MSQRTQQQQKNLHEWLRDVADNQTLPPGEFGVIERDIRCDRDVLLLDMRQVNPDAEYCQPDQMDEALDAEGIGITDDDEPLIGLVSSRRPMYVLQLYPSLVAAMNHCNAMGIHPEVHVYELPLTYH